MHELLSQLYFVSPINNAQIVGLNSVKNVGLKSQCFIGEQRTNFGFKLFVLPMNSTKVVGLNRLSFFHKQCNKMFGLITLFCR